MIQLESKTSGRYRFTRVQSKSGDIREQTPWFDNLITNNGLDLMNDGGYLNECAVGTDSTTPDFTDTSLGSQVASTTQSTRTKGKQITTSPFYTFMIKTFEFAEGAAAGNLAEVGVGNSTVNLFSRALIKDGSGNPTTITVLSDEFLRVEYEFRAEIPETDTTGTFDIDGTTYTWTGRAGEIDNRWDLGASSTEEWAISSSTFDNRAYEGDIGSLTTTPSGSSEEAGSVNVLTYNAGDNKSSAVITYGPTNANFTNGIGAIALFPGGVVFYQIGFSPKIPKTDVDEFTITVSHSWTRK